MNANGMFSPNLIALTRLRTYTCHSYLNIYYVFMNVWIFGQFVDVVCVFFFVVYELEHKRLYTNNVQTTQTNLCIWQLFHI